MGRRSATETAIAVLGAFIQKRRWEQAELARHVGVQPRALKAVLNDLERHQVPLQRKELSGREIHWSVPKAWVPKGAVLTNAQAGSCVRLLGRMPKSEARDELLRRLMGPAAVAFARADREEASVVLAELEDCSRQGLATRIVYESASSRVTRARFVSVHHLAYGPRVRFVASSHESGRLLWFRADRVHRAEPSRTEPFRHVPDEDVRAFVAGSVDGFARGEPIVCRFFVTGDVAAWVKGTLPVADARVTDVAGGLEIEVRTAGLEILARFVVGLGDQAQAWTPELAARVRQLAEGALGAAPPSNRSLRDSARPPASLVARGGGER